MELGGFVHIDVGVLHAIWTSYHRQVPSTFLLLLGTTLESCVHFCVIFSLLLCAKIATVSYVYVYLCTFPIIVRGRINGDQSQS